MPVSFVVLGCGRQETAGVYPGMYPTVLGLLGVHLGVRGGVSLPSVFDPWTMQLAIDARDMDTIRVRPQRFGGGPQIHLAVRTGPLLVYCLDGEAVGSIAAAWAQAQASSAHLLPAGSFRAKPVPVKRAGRVRFGDGYPVAEVVAEGYQRWNVIPPHPGQNFAVVMTDWLTVKVHDRPALETYTQAWAGACAVAIRDMPNPPGNFDRLLREAFDRELALRYPEEPSGRDR